MKLAPAEAKAIKFVLLVIALSAFARWLKRPEPVQVEPARPQVAEAAAISGPGALRAAKPSGPLDPNTASLADLDRLPGIGEATARKIVMRRPYHSLEDLERAIGRKRAQSLADRLTLRAATAQSDRAPQSIDRSEGRAERAADPNRPIDLNRATQTELEQLPGVGPSLAKRLIARRDSLRGFKDWSQVDSVNGIGPALLKRLKAASTM